MELFQSLQPFIGILIGTLLLNAINHYYVKDSKKDVKIYIISYASIFSYWCSWNGIWMYTL